ncbi:hypothetical protein TNCV_1426801 [Trichonephila clavipes]|nr:hypothetical protein TNCV_1426801 [Trichonephila clavipes]
MRQVGLTTLIALVAGRWCHDRSEGLRFSFQPRSHQCGRLEPITYGFLGKTPEETYEMLVRVYEEQTLSMKCVYEWFTCFREGRESVSDNLRSGRLATPDRGENIEKDDIIASQEAFEIAAIGMYARRVPTRHGLVDIFGNTGCFADRSNSVGYSCHQVNFRIDGRVKSSYSPQVLMHPSKCLMIWFLPRWISFPIQSNRNGTEVDIC